MNEKELIEYYNKFNEDKRLDTRHGQIEFITVTKYIDEIIKKIDNPNIIDIGAGTGKYSIYLKNKGYDVTAVELVKHNLKEIEKKDKTIKTYLGSATDLSKFKDKSFDIILLFGPLYHLITDEEKLKALNEAKKILKDDGYIFTQYCLNDFAIMKHGFIDNNINKDNNIDENFNIISKNNDLYSFVRQEKIDEFNNKLNFKLIKRVSVEGLTEYFRKDINKLNDDNFKKYIEYHLSVCERKDMLGTSRHILDILKKM